MSAKVGLQFRSIANWLLLCLNILLLAFLVFHWLLPLDRAVATTRKDAATLGMDVYCARSPFALFVDKDFPRKNTFKIFDYSQQLVVSAEDVDGKGDEASKEVAILLGGDFSISCVYSLFNGVHVRELTFSDLKNESLVDLNADGTFDMRIPLNAKRPLLEIWYKGKWREGVLGDGRGKYEKKLVGGEVVSFDMTSGLWLPPTEKRASKSDKENN